MSSPFVISVGLVCDIFGAILLAAPDVDLLSKKFEFGRLRYARDRMESGGIQQGETGFESLLDIIKAVDPAAEASAEAINDEVVEIIVDRRTGFATSKADFQWGEEYVEARYEDEANWDEADMVPVGEVYRRIREEATPEATRVRAIGLLLLAGGFSLQLVGNII